MTKIQNQGRPKLSNIQKIQAQLWYCEVLRQSKAKNTNDLAKKLKLGRPDSLYKAKSGKGSPDETTQKLAALKYPRLRNYYNRGPLNMIKIMNMERLRDACEAIQEQLIDLLAEQGISFSETPFVYDGGPRYQWLLDLGLALYQKKDTYSLDDNIIPLIFAISYCEHKLLDSKKSLTRLINVFLDHFACEFGINPKLWMSDINIIEAVKYAESFKKLNELMKKVN
jgi:hypothetical protein